MPVTSTLLLSNSNPFPVRTGNTHVDIFAGAWRALSRPAGRQSVGRLVSRLVSQLVFQSVGFSSQAGSRSVTHVDIFADAFFETFL